MGSMPTPESVAPEIPGSTRRGKKIAHDWEQGAVTRTVARARRPGERPVEKVHVSVGTIGHIDHGKTTLTAAILAVQATKGLARPKSYQDISKGGNVRDATKTVTIVTSHVEYETERQALRPHRLPRPRRLCEEHDHRGGADGRSGAPDLGG